MLIYALSTLFLLPVDNQFRHALIVLPLFTGVLLLLLLRAGYAPPELLLGAALVITALINGNYDALSDAVALAALLLYAALLRRLQPAQIVIDRRLLWGAALLLTAVLIRQLVGQLGSGVYAEFSTTLVVGDANFSGVLLLLYLFFSQRAGFRPGLWLAAAGVVLLLSRAYFLALIAYALLCWTQPRLAGWFARINFLTLLLALNALLLLYAQWVLTVGGIPDFGTRGLERLITFDDRSALTRLDYNRRLLEILLADPQLLWFGAGERFRDAAELLLGKVPHNTLFYLLGSHGLLMLAMQLIGLNRLFTLLDWRRNYPAVVPLICYALVLHGLFGKGYLLVLALTLALPHSAAGNDHAAAATAPPRAADPAA
jgi:hypothetical protein